VAQALDNNLVEPNHVYCIPPNSEMALLNGVLQLSQPKAARGMRLPIDAFFRSLADEQAEFAIGSILSGTASDGTQGLRATSAQEGMELLALHEVAVVMSDQRMPQTSGAEFLAKVRVMYPDTVCIILSGNSDLESITDVINRGEIYKFVEKPWDGDTLKRTLVDAFRHYAERQASRGNAGPGK
jgi:chemotaxis response regulator CheB